MFADVTEYIKSCVECQQIKIDINQLISDTLLQRAPPTHHFEEMCINCITKLLVTSQQRYISNCK
jgi:hypothetical protein